MKSTKKFFQSVTAVLFLAVVQGCYYAPAPSPAPTRAPRVTVERPLQHTRTYTHQHRDAIFNFDRLIQQKAQRYGVDYYLLLAIGQAESSGNPGAKSSANCRGLTQLKLSTARDYEPGVNYSDLHNPDVNLDIGARHMAYLRALVHRTFPNASLEQRVVLIAAAWNAGWSRVKNNGGVPRIRETQNYAEKVLRYYRKYRWNQG